MVETLIHKTSELHCPRSGLLRSVAEAGEDLVVLALQLAENGGGRYLQRHFDTQVRIARVIG